MPLDDRGLHHALGQQRGARERVRRAGGNSRQADFLDRQRAAELFHVGRKARERAPRRGARAAEAGAVDVQHARAEQARERVVGMALAARAGQAVKYQHRRAGGGAVFGYCEVPAVGQGDETIDADGGQPGPKKWRA